MFYIQVQASTDTHRRLSDRRGCRCGDLAMYAAWGSMDKNVATELGRANFHGNGASSRVPRSQGFVTLVGLSALRSKIHCAEIAVTEAL